MQAGKEWSQDYKGAEGNQPNTYTHTYLCMHVFEGRLVYEDIRKLNII